MNDSFNDFDLIRHHIDLWQCTLNYLRDLDEVTDNTQIENTYLHSLEIILESERIFKYKMPDIFKTRPLLK